MLYNSRKTVLTKQYSPQFVSQVEVDGIITHTDCSKQVAPQALPSDPVVMFLLWALEGDQCPGAG